MNNILATFTRSEKWLISAVLVLVGCGYGIQEFQSSQQNTMTFDVAQPRPENIEVSKVLPAGMTSEGRIDINAADAKVLETLPGIGPALAGAIIRARDTKGPFKSMADLDAVPGIGPAMMAKLSPMVEFGGVTGAPLVNPMVPVQSLAPPQAHAGAMYGSLEGGKVNINTASAEQLDQLTGVGPAIARRILEDRQMRGAYGRPEDLMRVKGVGPSIMQKNLGRITVQ